VLLNIQSECLTILILVWIRHLRRRLDLHTVRLQMQQATLELASSNNPTREISRPAPSAMVNMGEESTLIVADTEFLLIPNPHVGIRIA
jgi:hypothetical protein